MKGAEDRIAFRHAVCRQSTCVPLDLEVAAGSDAVLPDAAPAFAA